MEFGKFKIVFLRNGEHEDEYNVEIHYKGDIKMVLYPENIFLVKDTVIESDKFILNGVSTNGYFIISWDNLGINIIIGTYGSGEGGSISITLSDDDVPDFNNIILYWNTYVDSFKSNVQLYKSGLSNFNISDLKSVIKQFNVQQFHKNIFTDEQLQSLNDSRFTSQGLNIFTDEQLQDLEINLPIRKNI